MATGCQSKAAVRIQLYRLGPSPPDFCSPHAADPPLPLCAGGGVGPGIWLVTVLTGEALGLALNWRLCRGWLRPRVQFWLGRKGRGQRLQGLLEKLLQAPASLRLPLLLCLTQITRNLVTPWGWSARCADAGEPARRRQRACHRGVHPYICR
jgi:hypothetical protein